MVLGEFRVEAYRSLFCVRWFNIGDSSIIDSHMIAVILRLYLILVAHKGTYTERNTRSVIFLASAENDSWWLSNSFNIFYY